MKGGENAIIGGKKYKGRQKGKRSTPKKGAANFYDRVRLTVDPNGGGKGAGGPKKDKTSPCYKRNFPRNWAREGG